MSRHFRFGAVNNSAILLVICLSLISLSAHALTLTGAQSRKVHGTAGTYDLAINRTAPIAGVSTIAPQQASVLAALNVKKPAVEAQMSLL